MQEKVVFITGASSGIGKFLALEYARNGYALVIAARRADQLEMVKAECNRLDAKCEVLVLDLENREAVTAAANRAIGFFGRIDLLINNAGKSQRGTAANTGIDVVRTMMEINFFGGVTLSQALLPEIRKNKGGIVVISSMSGLFGFHGRSAYSASKFAMHGYFESISVEEPDIFVSLVCPGRIKTDISLHALAADGSPHGKMDEGQLNGIDVEFCAKKIYNGVKDRRALIIIAREEKILYWVKKISLSWFYKLARKAKSN